MKTNLIKLISLIILLIFNNYMTDQENKFQIEFKKTNLKI